MTVLRDSGRRTISIVTITLNRRDMLREAIESVVAQNYPTFEHIIVDGGSTDGTVELLGRYPHLKWISEPDQGQADAMNKGLRMATGDIFGWLNSDDSYPQGAFEAVCRTFVEHPGLAMIYGTCNIIDNEGRPIGRTRFHKFALRRLQMGFVNINTPAVFVRLPVLREEGGFDTALKATYDSDMWIRIGQRFTVMPVREALSNLRLHSGSGLVSTRHHLGEIPMLRNRYWTSRSRLERFVVFPYYVAYEWAYQFLKFRRLARRAV